MSNRAFRAAAVLAVAFAVTHGASARAQYGRYAYPRGYGDWGWGGWGGGGGGGATVQGDIARGLGTFAASAGAYNEQTARARAVNTDTLIQWNQYVYQSQLEANRRHHERMAERQLGNVKARDQIYRRLRDNPEPRDVDSGDALNVAFDEINNPQVYTKTLRAAKVKVGGEAVRDIPFQYAAAAISTSVHELTQGGPPPLLKTPAFDPERAELRRIADAARRQAEQGGSPSPEQIRKAQDLLKAMRTKLESTTDKSAPGYAAAERYLKAAYGLTRMLETPAVDVLLSGVEKNRPDATLGELLSFMNAFNLRFGQAKTPRQREVYQALYPLLVGVRNEVAPALASAGDAPAAPVAKAGEFFSGMKFQDLEKTPPPPVPPAPGPR